MQDLDFFQQTYGTAVKDLEKEIAKSASYLAETFPKDDPFYAEIERFTLHGGKRFRPALSLVVARAFGQEDVFPHVALEVFHKYLLVHDDFIDRDAMRYGQPTVHAKMTQLRGASEDSVHFGGSLAVIGGDLLAAATHKIILEAALTPEVKIALQKLIVRAVEEVSWGWYDQFLMDYLPLDAKTLNFVRIESSLAWVTGKYSIKLPFLFGYTLAGKQVPSELEALADVLGILYQTGDDLIGLFGEQEATGKSNFGDIVQGKKTLPIWLTFTLASSADRAALMAIVGNKHASAKDIQKVREIIKKSGGLAQAKELMKTYGKRSLELLDILDMPEDLKRFLRGFVEFIESRNA